MLKSPILRDGGENQVRLKKSPGREGWTTITPSRRDAAPHPFAIRGGAAARPRRSSSWKRGSPACCFDRCEWSGCPSRAITAVSKSVAPEKQVAQRGLLICACLASSLDIRSTAVTVFRSFESRQRVINAVGCFQCYQSNRQFGRPFPLGAVGF